jgi:DNA segregation ATPase FtsK/SpoIIIE, S-DNA-T family
MGFTILESGVFLREFVGDLATLDALCKNSERECYERIAAKQREHASELSSWEQMSTLAVLEVNDAIFGVDSKESALRRCEKRLNTIAERDSTRLAEIYGRITKAKISWDTSNLVSLRAELFANKEQVKKERDEAWQEYQTVCAKISKALELAQKEKNEKTGAVRTAQSKEFKEYEATSQKDKDAKINGEIKKFNEKFNPKAIERQCVDILAQEPLVANYECKKEIPANVRLGTLSYNLLPLKLGEHAKTMLEEHYHTLYKRETLNIPYCTVFNGKFNYLFDVGKEDHIGRATLIDRACSLAMRLFMMIPPGKVNFTFIDTIELGGSFELFGQFDDDRTNKVINGKIFTKAADISERLNVLADHIANVQQNYLQKRYANIQEYNRLAEQNVESYQILMIMDFPGGFNENSLGQLEKIIAAGPKCGVYTIILRSGEQMDKIDGRLKPLMNNIESKTTLFKVNGEGIRLTADVLNEKTVPFKINPLLRKGQLEIVIPKLKDGIKNVERIVIDFCKRLLPAKGDRFKGNSAPELVIPIGIIGVNEVQNLVLGGTSAHHALIIGQTGSGKSSLLHTIIMSSLVRYTADELSIFLVDFKQGVEFKIYANHALKAFRVVAIESEREFGGNVLTFIEKERRQRAELFRRADVDDIQAYRNKTKSPMPRILLIIDEFQVLFSNNNDKVCKDAAANLELIIAQGRAFGIHVALASQTMANVGGIHQSLWGQVGVRIALKCPPSDAKLILPEDNNKVDLLAVDEPGQAVYNPDCGNKDKGKIFRVAYMERDKQDELLKDISNDAPRPQTAFPETRVMVSNIEDNLYHPYQKFIEGGKPDEFNERAVLIGEPMQLSGKLRSVFKAKDSSNMLIIGNDVHKARAMFAFSALSLSIHAIAENGWKRPRNPYVHIMDFAPPEEEDEKAHDALLTLKDKIRGYVKYEEFDDSIDILKELHRNLSTGGDAAEDRYLLIFGLQRARSLRQSGDPNADQKAAAAIDDNLGLEIAPKPSVTPYQIFMSVLNDGPAKNTHAVVWVDNFKTFQAHYPGLLRLFDLRVGFTMANEDSVLFMEEPEGSQISENNAVLSYNGNQKFRTYQTPDPEWLTDICERINTFQG